MTDIVDRLRNRAIVAPYIGEWTVAYTEAADKIVEVRAERDAAITDNARLRALITEASEAAEEAEDDDDYRCCAIPARLNAALAALDEEANR